RTVVHQRVGKVGFVVVPLMIVVSYLALIDFGRRGHDLSGDVIRALSRTGSRPFDSAGLVFPLGAVLCPRCTPAFRSVVPCRLVVSASPADPQAAYDAGNGPDIDRTNSSFCWAASRPLAATTGNGTRIYYFLVAASSHRHTGV